MDREGHKPKLTHSDHYQNAASRAGKRENVQRQEEEARQQRLARWQGFQPTTQRCLERVEVLGGPGLAEQLAEAIWNERTQPNVAADLAAEHVTGTVRAEDILAIATSGTKRRCEPIA